LELDYPLSGAIDIVTSHSLYNQDTRKVIYYENQYRYAPPQEKGIATASRVDCARLLSARHLPGED
jgi:hypothetical protein